MAQEPRRGSVMRSISEIGHSITSDLHPTKLGLIHPRRVPLVKSPLAKHGEEDEHGHGHGHSSSGGYGGSGTAAHHKLERNDSSDSEAGEDLEEPKFRFHQEAPTIQLFYDLFFVANITTFTSQHEITSGTALKSYVGFFSLLWFTWFQVALFDVRFGNDSVFERFCKLVQFGVMVGMSCEGSLYQLGDEFQPKPFRVLSFIFMVSRLVLCMQYLVAFYWTREYKKAHLPILLHVLVLFTSAMIFLGLGIGFKDVDSQRLLDGWYITQAAEALAVLVISAPYKFLNFQGTHIVERLGLLTLIILGEGIMGLGEIVGKIQTADQVFTADVIGQIICAVMVVYSIYMLYFDQIETEGHKPHSLRQQIWTILHFPLHLSILLTCCGSSQLIIWRRFCDYLNATAGVFGDIPQAATENAEAWTEYVSSLGVELTAQWPNLASNFSEPLHALSESIGNSTLYENTGQEIIGIVTKAAATRFEIDIEELSAITDPLEVKNEFIGMYSTVFIYFFAAAGTVLIMLAILFMLGKTGKSRIEYISMASRFFVGLGLALIPTMIIPYENYRSAEVPDDNVLNGKPVMNFLNYFEGPWLSSTVVISYTLLTIMDVALIIFSRVMLKRRMSKEKAKYPNPV